MEMGLKEKVVVATIVSVTAATVGEQTITGVYVGTARTMYYTDRCWCAAARQSSGIHFLSCHIVTSSLSKSTSNPGYFELCTIVCTDRM